MSSRYYFNIGVFTPFPPHPFPCRSPLIQLYGMNIPIFTPGLELATTLDMQGSGMSMRVGADEPLVGYSPPLYPPSPNNRSYEATRFWLSLSDFMTFPHIQHFDDDISLMHQLCKANFDSISNMMKATNSERMDEAIQFWSNHFRSHLNASHW